ASSPTACRRRSTRRRSARRAGCCARSRWPKRNSERSDDVVSEVAAPHHPERLFVLPIANVEAEEVFGEAVVRVHHAGAVDHGLPRIRGRLEEGGGVGPKMVVPETKVDLHKDGIG